MFANFFMDANNTLAMEPIGLDGQNNPLSRSSEPQSRLTPNFIVFHIRLSMYFLGFRILTWFLKNIFMDIR